MLIYLNIVEGLFSIYQLNVHQEIPVELLDSGFWSITKTSEEISIVSACRLDSDGLKVNHGWKAFKVEGPLDFSQTGIIYQITGQLKNNNISVFVISTYNTDYILVKEESFSKAVELFQKGTSILIR